MQQHVRGTNTKNGGVKSFHVGRDSLATCSRNQGDVQSSDADPDLVFFLKADPYPAFSSRHIRVWIQVVNFRPKKNKQKNTNIAML